MFTPLFWLGACIALLGCPAAEQSTSAQSNLSPDVPTSPYVVWHFADAPASLPVRAGGALYLGRQSLFRLDEKTGAVLSRFDREDTPKGFWVSPLAVWGEHVIALHSNGTVVCLDHTLTKTHWEIVLEGKAGDFRSRFPGVLTGNVYVVAVGNEIFALHADTGAVRWRHNATDSVQMSPATDGDWVFFGNTSGSFRALDIRTGQMVWEHKGAAKYGWTNPVAVDGVVFVGDRGIGNSCRLWDAGKLTADVDGNRAGALNAFDAQSGELLWGRIFGATGLSRPHVSGNRVYVGFGKIVVPLRVDTGAFIHDAAVKTGSNPFGSPTIIGDSLVFGNLDGHLYVHDRHTGELRWAIHAEGHQVGSFIVADGTIYVSSGAGLLAIADAPGEEPLPSGTVIKWGSD